MNGIGALTHIRKERRTERKDNGINTDVTRKDNGINTDVTRKDNGINTDVTKDNGINTDVTKDNGINTEVTRKDNGINTDVTKDNGINTDVTKDNGINTDVTRATGNFSRFPTEIDIMLEVVSKNVDLVRACNEDLRGSSRACCNSATKCFDDFKTIIDEVDKARSDSFAQNSACRKLTSQLKRDQLCVKQSLSRCTGPDRAMLEQRFGVRLSNMNDQFYRHCKKDEQMDTTVITSTESVRILDQTTTQQKLSLPGLITKTTTINTSISVLATTLTNNQTKSDNGYHVVANNISSSASFNAILAGVVTGGVVLLLLLVLTMALWCKKKRTRNTSGSSSESLGVFFQKRPNMCLTDQPRGSNNNKPPRFRQDSSIYAEIDDNKVNPSYKPPAPGELPETGYLNPITDEQSSLYTVPLTNGPLVTTRGRFSCGQNLIADRDLNYPGTLFYNSTSITKILDAEMSKDQKNVSLRSLPPTPQPRHSEDLSAINYESNCLNDYEQPISANSSQHYTELDNKPPNHLAPAVPVSAASDNNQTSTCAVKVLPSNPFVPYRPRSESAKPDQYMPVATPRRTKNLPCKDSLQTDCRQGDIVFDSASDSGVHGTIKLSDIEPTSRDNNSTVNSGIAYQYFVLEPDNQNEYENSVSAPQLV